MAEEQRVRERCRICGSRDCGCILGRAPENLPYHEPEPEMSEDPTTIEEIMAMDIWELGTRAGAAIGDPSWEANAKIARWVAVQVARIEADAR